MEQWLDVCTIFAALGYPLRLSLLLAVMEDGPVRQFDLATKVDVPSAGYLSGHLDGLLQAGLLVKETVNGRHIVYHATPAAGRLRSLLVVALDLAREIGENKEGAR